MLSNSRIHTRPQLSRELFQKPAALVIRFCKPFFAGFLTAGAAFWGAYQPLCLGLLWALNGSDAAAAAAGAALSCLIFWRRSQLLLWIACGWLLSWLRPRWNRPIPWLREALGAAILSASGLVFQLLGEDTSIPVYLLRVCLGALAPGLFIPLFAAFPKSIAQVRLELSAQVLEQSRRVIASLPEEPIDEEALILRARERACGSCPASRFCRDRDRTLPEAILRRPLVGNSILPWQCREPGKLILELRRSQEQLRLLKSDRQKCSQYRSALVQQYGFLSEFLQKTADSLPGELQHHRSPTAFETAVRSSKGLCSGDKCLRFGRFLLLCDGMGTGPGAARDARFASELLRKLLLAGYPAEAALESFNSLCSLSLSAGAVTVDLAQVEEGGYVTLFKWGAGKSYVLKQGKLRPLGRLTLPPGMAVTENCGKTRLHLHPGEVLLLCSDGVSFPAGTVFPGTSPGSDLKAMARQIFSRRTPSKDDATLALIRLREELPS